MKNIWLTVNFIQPCKMFVCLSLTLVNNMFLTPIKGWACQSFLIICLWRNQHWFRWVLYYLLTTEFPPSNTETPISFSAHWQGLAHQGSSLSPSPISVCVVEGFFHFISNAKNKIKSCTKLQNFPNFSLISNLISKFPEFP